MRIKLTVIVLFLVFFPLCTATLGQTYRAEYKGLPSELLTGNTPTICILEDDSSQVRLFDGLSQYAEIKSRFNSFSTATIMENKDLLKVEELNPEDKNFLSALNEQLSIDYVLAWKALPDSVGVYQLTVYSTKSGQRIYNSNFYSSMNSDPVLDVMKLLVENQEPVYTSVFGEVEVNSKPDGARFKLYKDSILVKEWSGRGRQKVAAGKYRLITEAERYMSDESQIEVPAERTAFVEINMKPDVAQFPVVYSTDNRISNIKLKVEGEELRITYDLISDEGDEYDLKLTISDTLSKAPPAELRQISGDIKEVKPKQNNTISWQYKNELGKDAPLKNYNIAMRLEEKGGVAWYYYAVPAVVGAGAAALLIGGGGDDGTPASGRTAIEPPPDRP